jgi:hypothetical protein
VKFVAHSGEVATQTIRGRSKLIGVDVIAAHRLLKNTVPPAEYVLMSEPLYQRLEPKRRSKAVRLDQEVEGIGTIPSYYLDLSSIPIELPPPSKPSLLARARETTGIGIRGLPHMIQVRGDSRRTL